jgi:hypothetical protein
LKEWNSHLNVYFIIIDDGMVVDCRHIIIILTIFYIGNNMIDITRTRLSIDCYLTYRAK